jgi:hypothetical protein
MKTNNNKAVLLFLLMIIIGSSTFAAKPNTMKEEGRVAREISTEIKSKISFPEFLLTQNGSEFFTEVAFKVNHEGEILITEINSADLQLREEVKKQLERMKLNHDAINNDDTYRVVLRFRAI